MEIHMQETNDTFPWMSYYGHFNFFDRCMNEHDKVNSIDKINPSLYNIELTSGVLLKVFICDCYSFDIAEYIETCENYGKLNAIIINSRWCGYSPDVKSYCIKRQVGIFDTIGFMAAINRSDYWNYLTSYEKTFIY